ncbi:MAG: hypothetical protein FJZ96_06760 [Chloroflexi bacterium]|nr:hypothetical protein [Chloroflexota bacterium]
MNIGMMWLDNDPKTPLSTKVERAADYYRRKYGRLPDLCLVNPVMLGAKGPEPAPTRGERIAIRSLRSILPGHLWLGVDDDLPSGVD